MFTISAQALWKYLDLRTYALLTMVSFSFIAALQWLHRPSCFVSMRA
jgi:hypothetical protein